MISFLVIENKSYENIVDEKTNIVIPPLCKMFVIKNKHNYIQQCVSLDEIYSLRMSEDDIEYFMYNKLERLLETQEK